MEVAAASKVAESSSPGFRVTASLSIAIKVALLSWPSLRSYLFEEKPFASFGHMM